MCAFTQHLHQHGHGDLSHLHVWERTEVRASHAVMDEHLHPLEGERMTVNEEPENEECPYMDGGGDECYYCRYYHDPCFPDLGDDDE